MNQTDVRTFKAATMQEALDIVRRELGPEAVILHTREIPQPRFLKWRSVKDRVEVTAAEREHLRCAPALLSSSARRRSPALAPPRKIVAGMRRHSDNLRPPPTRPARATAHAC